MKTSLDSTVKIIGMTYVWNCLAVCHEAVGVELCFIYLQERRSAGERRSTEKLWVENADLSHVNVLSPTKRWESLGFLKPPLHNTQHQTPHCSPSYYIFGSMTKTIWYLTY